MSQNRVNKIIIGKDISRTSSLQITAPGTTATYIAEGEVIVVDKDFNLLAAGATISDSDIIYIGVGSGETFDYTLPSGTAVTGGRRIEYSGPIKGSKVKTYKGVSADSAAVERQATINIDGASSFAPVVGTEYVIRIVYKDILEHPGQFTQTYRVVATSVTPSVLTTAFVAAINGDSGARVIASKSGNDLVITGKVIPNNATNVEIDEYSQVDFDAYLYSNNFSDVTVTYNTYAEPGNGNPKIVRDREKFALSYEGVMNRTHFPVKLPTMKTDMTKWYDSIIIEHEQEYVSADNEYTKQAPATTEVYIPANAGQTTNVLAVLNPWMASTNKLAVTL